LIENALREQVLMLIPGQSRYTYLKKTVLKGEKKKKKKGKKKIVGYQTLAFNKTSYKEGC